MKYIGNGFLRGIPARDLTAAEVKKFGKERLLQSGLYAEVKAKKKKAENKLGKHKMENKTIEE